MQKWSEPSDRLKVLSTTAMIDDLVGEVGGNRVVHLPLILGEIDPHSYELVKGDDEKFSMAQLIFYNGLGLEHGASLRYQLEHHPHAVSLGKALMDESPDRLISIDHEIDPHVWMDISLWSQTVLPIAEALSMRDPDGREYYLENARALQLKMIEAHEEVYRVLQSIPEEKRYLVTSHDAFYYFTRAYLATPEERAQNRWQVRFDAPEGLSPDGQLSTADIQQVIDHLIRYQIRVVFPESNVSRDSLKKIQHACAQKGLKILISNHVLYGDAMGPTGGDADTYLKMIRHDADVLVQELEQ